MRCKFYILLLGLQPSLVVALVSELVRLRTQESTDSQFSSDLREFASTRHIVFPECESLANFDCSSRDVCINLTSSIFEPLLFGIASLQHSTDLETPSTVLKGIFDAFC